ncbi:MAG: hypothetical protein WD512_04150, partial [Candidatus Paceibacterota bacterium]
YKYIYQQEYSHLLLKLISDPICDINNWENILCHGNGTKLILFFNQNRLDQISLNHINQAIREKISIINIKGGETNRQSIRTSIIENIDFLNCF